MTSARKRRAEIPNLAQNAPKLTPAFNAGTAQPPRPPPAGGLTIQQVVAIMDRRISTLEGGMNDLRKTVGVSAEKAATAPAPAAVAPEVSESLDELYNRFDILVGEVAELKDTLMKLQTYTMEVNRVLVEDKLTAGAAPTAPTFSEPATTEETPVEDDAAAVAPSTEEIVVQPTFSRRRRGGAAAA